MNNEAKEFLIAILANIVTEFGRKVITKLRTSKTSQEELEAINEAKGMIKIAAANGEINLDGATIKALESIQCDHGNGQISIDQTQLQAAMLKTGGFEGNSTGYTHITNSNFKSRGTEISLGSGSSITIKGNASITQS